MRASQASQASLNAVSYSSSASRLTAADIGTSATTSASCGTAQSTGSVSAMSYSYEYVVRQVPAVRSVRSAKSGSAELVSPLVAPSSVPSWYPSSNPCSNSSQKPDELPVLAKARGRRRCTRRSRACHRIPNAPMAMPAMAHPRPALPLTLIRRSAAMPSPSPTGPGSPPKNSRPAVLVTNDAIAMPSVGGGP